MPGDSIGQFADRSSDKDPTAVEVDHDRESGGDPLRPREADRLIHEPLLYLVGVVENGKSQDDAEREAIAKHLGTVARVLVMAGRVPGVSRVAPTLVRLAPCLLRP
jgi:hypothetical protein